MKRLLLVLAASFVGALALAQQTHVDEIWIDTRASFHQDWTDGAYNSHFQGDYLNLHIKGQLTDRLTFRIRQRLNKKIDDQNPFNATDFLWLRWQAAPFFSLTLGKQPIFIGGYEIDSAPIDVYYYGAFSNHLLQYYAFGATATFSPAQGQDIGVVVAAGHLRGEAVPAAGAADALDLVGRHGHADAGAAAEDALLALPGEDAAADLLREYGVVAARLRIRPEVGEGDVLLRKILLDLFLEGVAPVVTSQCDHRSFSLSSFYARLRRGERQCDQKGQ